MPYRSPTVIDMTPSGEFLSRPAQASLAARIGVVATLVAVAAAAVSAAALILWLAVVMLPVALVAGLIAYAAFKLQLWRVRAP